MVLKNDIFVDKDLKRLYEVEELFNYIYDLKSVRLKDLRSDINFYVTSYELGVDYFKIESELAKVLYE